MRNKNVYEMILNNLATHDKFYLFNRVHISNEVKSFNFDGHNPLLQYGLPMFFNIHNCTSDCASDIAYEEDGVLYHVVTSAKVNPVKEGENIVEEGAILAAANIRLASTQDIKIFLSNIKDKGNMSFYRYVLRLNGKRH